MPAAAAGSVCHSSDAEGPTDMPQTLPDRIKHDRRERERDKEKRFSGVHKVTRLIAPLWFKTYV